MDRHIQPAPASVRRAAWFSIILLGTVAWFAMASSCELSPEQQQAFNEALTTADDTIEQLEADLAAARADLGTIEDADERLEAEQAIDELEDAVAKSRRIRLEIDQYRDEEGNIDPTSAGVAAASHFLPPPWNILAPSLAALGIGLARSWQNKQKAVKIIEAVENAKRYSPEFEKAMTDSDARPALDTMGPGAKKLVDKVQKGRFVIPV